jgi:DNA primase
LGQSSKDLIKQVKEKVPLSEVVSPFVDLSPSGHELIGLSPFQNEKTPSFYVNDQKGVYYCFSSHRSGDHISFLMDVKGLSFPKAVLELGDRAGGDLKNQVYEQFQAQYRKQLKKSGLNSQKADLENQDREYRLKVNRLAGRFFFQNFRSEPGERARNYLQKRGIDSKLTESFRLGFAEDDYHSLEKHLRQSQAPLQLAVDAGLLGDRKDGKGQYDIFRNRLMFPIFEVDGGVIGFGGRTLDDVQKPKYLNSRESPLFHKSKALYGIHKARKEIQRLDQVVVVEGFMDVLSMHQHGFSHTVGVLGTALSDEHLERLKRFSKNIVLLFDSDRAGRDAVEGSLERIFHHGMRARVVQLPQDKDPDDYLKQESGASKMKELLEKAEDFLDFLIKKNLHDVGTSYTDRMRVSSKILRWICLAPEDSAVQRMRVKDLADRLQLRSDILEEEWGKMVRSGSFRAKKGGPIKSPGSAISRPMGQKGADVRGAIRPPKEEVALTRLLAFYPALSDDLRSSERFDLGKISHPESRKILDYALTYGALSEFPVHELTDQDLRSAVIEGLMAKQGFRSENQQEELKKERSSQVQMQEMLAKYFGNIKPQELLADVLLKLEIESLVRERKRVTLEKRQSPQDQEILRREFELNRKIHSLRNRSKDETALGPT